jgi:hypothetical protein
MLLAQVADYPLSSLLTALEQLEAAGIIRPSSLRTADCYDFAHDVVRQVVYETVSAPRQGLMHRQIAQRLESMASNNSELIAEVARHASLSQHHELAANASLQAAQQCLQVFAYGEATEFVQQGLNHCSFLAPRTALTLQLSLWRTQVLAGVKAENVPRVEQTLQEGIQTARRLGLQDAETNGLEALLFLNYHHDRLKDLHHYSLQAAERGQAVHPSNSARILAISGACLTTMEQEMDRAEALLLEAEALAARIGAVLPDIPCGLGSVARFRGDRATACSYLAAAYEMGVAIQSYPHICMALTNWVMVDLEAGDWEAAFAHAQQLIPITQKMKEGSDLAFAEALATLARYAQVPDSVATALVTRFCELQVLDAPRKLTYLGSGAAEVDLQYGRSEPALIHATAALEAARVVAHPSDVVLAHSLFIRALIAASQFEQVQQEWHQLQAFAHHQQLSHRANQALAVTRRELKNLPEEATYVPNLN